MRWTVPRLVVARRGPPSILLCSSLTRLVRNTTEHAMTVLSAVLALQRFHFWVFLSSSLLYGLDSIPFHDQTGTRGKGTEHDLSYRSFR